MRVVEDFIKLSISLSKTPAVFLEINFFSELTLLLYGEEKDKYAFQTKV
jgi:hypothetical protein